MKRSERMGGPHTSRGVGEGRSTLLVGWGGVGGRLLDLSRNREVRVRAAADSETSLKSSRLMVLQEVQPAHIKST